MIGSIEITRLIGYSGLRIAQAARPSLAAASQRAFRPVASNGLKVSSARFASSDDAKHGKIHQVIGAVVDGRRKSLSTIASNCRSFKTCQPSYNNIMKSF
jgi:hypothetical protein